MAIYPFIFALYEIFIENRDFTEELINFLKLLPMSVTLKTAIVGLDREIFQASLNNHLFYWYFSTILRGIYLDTIKI